MTHSDQNIDELDRLFPSYGETSRLTVSCHKSDYSASRIARAVEDADAHLINLNVTSGGGFGMPGDSYGSAVIVELRVDVADPAGVIRSLGRYGFTLEDSAPGSGPASDSLRERVDELLYILKM